MSNTPNAQGRSWSDGSPLRSDVTYADIRARKTECAPRQSGDPSTEYGLLHIVCKAFGVWSGSLFPSSWRGLHMW